MASGMAVGLQKVHLVKKQVLVRSLAHKLYLKVLCFLFFVWVFVFFPLSYVGLFGLVYLGFYSDFCVTTSPTLVSGLRVM